MNKRIPYSVLVGAAILAHDEEKLNAAIEKAFGEMGHECCGVITKYPEEDLPFVIATMQIVANAMTSILDENGKSLVKKLTGNTQSIVINASGLIAQIGGDGKKEEE